MPVMDSIRILSFNVNGLGDHHKRKDVFDYLRRQKAQILFLQETHFKTQSENFVRSLWGGECILSGASTNRKGVAVFFSNDFEYKIHRVQRDEDGCYIIVDIEILGKRVIMVNIYGPSDGDCPLFFENVFTKINAYGNDNVIIGGDWNIAMDTNLDTFRYRQLNRKKSRNKLIEIMANSNLVDVYRETNPDKRAYTWRRFNTVQQSRLDYFLISDHLMLDVLDTDIKIGYRSDHRIVTLRFKKAEGEKRGRTYWKFNNSLLKDKQYVDLVKQTILELKKQYGVIIYDRDNIDKVPNNSLELTTYDQLFFEMILMEVRAKTISYSVYRKKENIKKEEALVKEIAEMEKMINETNIGTLEQKKAELETIRKAKVDGMIMRSRVKWIQEGEKNSKYFCNLEKRNYVEKAIYRLEREDGSILADTNSIKSEVFSFYKKLYDKNENGTSEVDLKTIVEGPSLSHEDSKSIEGGITIAEALEALKKMENSKSPGSDGFSIEFYKIFWNDLGTFLVRSINDSYSRGEMSVTQRQGVITCIPKEGKDKKLLNNWRPITLLNTAYKIASACIAQRIKSVLPSIIHESQTGFLPGRYIGENIRLIYDVLVHTECHNIPGLLLAIDFHKAFDSISWAFMQKALDFFGFGPDIKRWIQTFYTNINACVMVNGGYTSWFSVQRGVRQGDPCSPYIYLICAEILSLLIRNNGNIKGINLDNDV